MLYQRIRYFLQVAEHGSFSKAAEALYLSPQALMKQVSALEQSLGGKLLERSPQGVRLTTFGEQARRELHRLSLDCEQTLSALRAQASAAEDTVRLGIFSALPQEEMITPFVSFLLANFPGIHLELELLESGVGKEKLLTQQIDLLLTHIHEEELWESCRKLSFRSFPAQICVSLRHPWAVRDTVTLEDLAGAPFIKMQPDGGNYIVPAGQSFYDNIPCREIIQVRNFETMQTLLEQGSGFAVFPMFFSNMQHAHYKAFPYPGRALRFDLCLVCRTPGTSAASQRILDAAIDEYGLQEI